MPPPSIVQITNTRLEELREKVAKERELHKEGRNKDRIHLQAKLSVAQRVADFLQTDTQVQASQRKCKYNNEKSSEDTPLASDDPLQVERLQSKLAQQEVLLQQRDAASRAQLHKIRQLQKDVERQKEVAAATMMHKEAAQKEVQQLQEQIAQAQQDTEEWKVKLEQARNETEAQAREQQEQHQASQAQQEEKLQALQTELIKTQSEGNQWKEKLKKAHMAITLLQQQDTTLQQQLQSQQAQLQTQAAERARQQAHLEQLSAESDALEDNLNVSYNETLGLMANQVHDLEQALEQAQAEMEDLQNNPAEDNSPDSNELEEWKQQANFLQQELTVAQQAREKAETQVQEHSAKIASLTQGMGELEDYLNKSYTETLDLMVAQISALKNRLAEMEQSNELVDELSKQLTQAQAELEASAKECKEQQEHVEMLQKKLDASQGQAEELAESKTVVQELQVKHTIILQEKETAESSVTQLRQELEAAQTNAASQKQAQAESLTAKEKELESLNKELQSLKDELESSAHQTVDLKAELKKAQAQSLLLDQDLAANTQLVSDLRSGLSEQVETSQTKLEESSKLQTVVEELQVQMKEMQADMVTRERHHRNSLFGFVGLVFVVIAAMQALSPTMAARRSVTPVLDMSISPHPVKEEIELVPELEEVEAEVIECEIEQQAQPSGIKATDTQEKLQRESE